MAVWEEKRETPLSNDALVVLAHRRLMAQIEQDLSCGELLKKRLVGEFTDDAYILYCEAECLINIAGSVAFDAAES